MYDSIYLEYICGFSKSHIKTRLTWIYFAILGYRALPVIPPEFFFRNQLMGYVFIGQPYTVCSMIGPRHAAMSNDMQAGRCFVRAEIGYWSIVVLGTCRYSVSLLEPLDTLDTC